MFLAMQPKPPFDKKEVRQAVCHAINRDQIIATLLERFASRLDGPLGPGQYGYDPNLKPKLNYDPEKAKKLLAQAGFASGIDVELQTPVGRYTLDKQLTEAMIPMLNAVGIRAKLATPEWATLWANVQKGTVPFYYMGRGSVQDPERRIASIFSYRRNAAHRLFQPQGRRTARQRTAGVRSEKTPPIFVASDEHPHRRRAGLFHVAAQTALGLEHRVDYKPLPDSRVYAIDMAVKK